MIAACIFWILIGFIVYSFLGYTLVLLVIRMFRKRKLNFEDASLPPVTLMVAAYNEREVIGKKLANIAAINYPADKLFQVWINDGSDDGSYELLEEAGVKVIHLPERSGKSTAINRGMEVVTTPLVLFSDANAMLNREAVKNIVGYFSDPLTGCVAGEKKIVKKGWDQAVGSGEGMYWRYESFLKKLESEVNSTIGATGEIFAIRRHLFKRLETDTILDDFVISLQIAQNGFAVKYAAEAVATETSSLNIREELKRKIRIAAGSIQAMVRLKPLLNIFRYGFLSFQFWSHKVIRWTIVPLALLVCFPLSICLAWDYNSWIYEAIVLIQGLFYFFALIGLFFRNVRTHLHLIFIPYYIVTMNYAVLLGVIRYIRGNQSVNWEKSRRR